MNSEERSLLALCESSTEPMSLIGRLLAEGQTGIAMLEALEVQIRLQRFPADILGGLLLPWYWRDGFAKTGWFDPKAAQLTVASWAELPKRPHAEEVEELQKQGTLDSLGPIFNVHDSRLGWTVIVDGSKRACAAFLDHCELDAVILTSPYAALLYPAEFLHAAVLEVSKLKEAVTA